jgi:argininosuccinate synthase
MTVSPEKAPDRPTYLEMEFKNGNPVALDGWPWSRCPVQQLNNLAAKTASVASIWWRTALSA